MPNDEEAKVLHRLERASEALDAERRAAAQTVASSQQSVAKRKKNAELLARKPTTRGERKKRQ